MTVIIDTISKGRPRHPEKAGRPESPLLPKPDWIRVKAPVSRGYAATQAIVRENKLVTVCEEAGCPNIGECWEKKHATFMIMGDTCTRACAFCNVRTGLPQALDSNEPAHVAEAVAKLGQKREALEISVSNVELNWKMTPEMVKAAKTYADHMLALKQIKALPDFATFFNTSFSDELAKA